MTNLRKYFIEVGNHLDEFYMPPEEKQEDDLIPKLNRLLATDLMEHFKNNIAPDMAAEFIAFKLGLTRDSFKTN